MEADWEFEIAADAPVIDGAWAGFVDLRRCPDQVDAIAEVAPLPALRSVLLRLNAADSAVFTAKCDVWVPAEVDADELDAERGSAAHAIACYIDVLPVDPRIWSMPELAAAWARSVCARLANEPLRQCRVDLVVRRAFLTSVEQGIGITCYVTGCGATEGEAVDSLSRGVHAFSDSDVAAGDFQTDATME